MPNIQMSNIKKGKIAIGKVLPMGIKTSVQVVE
jgi:hypothetical protein